MKAKSCMCCPWGILARMDSEQLSVENVAALVWSSSSHSVFLLEGCAPEEKGQGMLKAV